MIFSYLRSGSNAVLHMSRIKCKWEKPFVLPHKHSIPLMWNAAYDPGLSSWDMLIAHKLTARVKCRNVNVNEEKRK